MREREIDCKGDRESSKKKILVDARDLGVCEGGVEPVGQSGEAIRGTTIGEILLATTPAAVRE